MTVLPSWNDYLSIARRPNMAQGLKTKWFKAGRKAAILAGFKSPFRMLKWIEHDLTPSGKTKQIIHERFQNPITLEPVKMVLRVWRPTFGRYDVFNPFIKSIVDGFIDAGILPDDDCFHVRSVSVEFMGVDERLKPDADAKEARRLKRLTSKARMPVSARYWFDFHRIID